MWHTHNYISHSTNTHRSISDMHASDIQQVHIKASVQWHMHKENIIILKKHTVTHVYLTFNKHTIQYYWHMHTSHATNIQLIISDICIPPHTYKENHMTHDNDSQSHVPQMSPWLSGVIRTGITSITFIILAIFSRPPKVPAPWSPWQNNIHSKKSATVP